jgi:hypothetical protein
VLALWAPLFACPARATDLQLTFGTLPSSQGWTYESDGSVAIESSAWTPGLGVLTLDTMPYGTGLPGFGTSSFYVRSGVVNDVEAVTIELRGRILEYENGGGPVLGTGFCFGFAQGSVGWTMGITALGVCDANGAMLSTAYDTHSFHDYRVEWAPPLTVRYYIDGTLIATDVGGAARPESIVYFGDDAESSNAHAQITRFRFQQAEPTPTRGSSWGRMKSLYR